VDRDRLAAALANVMPLGLAEDLVDNFLTIRQDAATRTYGRAAPGKFVETVVQGLQHMSAGQHDTSPKVEDFLKNRVEYQTWLDDGLRICAARISRATYALRSKRSIAHKGAIDPNSYDLDFVHSAARWILAELLRLSQGLAMEEAGALIEMVHAPVSRLVEEIDGHRLVHGNFSVRDEVLVLLHSHYPDHVSVASILKSLDRQKPASVRNRINELYRAKLTQGTAQKGYRLTTPGFDEAVDVIKKAISQ
jgi:hypothetical protein